MSEKKIIAICQSGGEFQTEKDGSMSYKGGEAYAVDLDTDTKVIDFKQDLAETFGYNVDNMLIKYFLPGNKKTLIMISKDKDLKRMINFFANGDQVDVFVMPQPIISNTPASRSSGTAVSEAIASPVGTSQTDNETGSLDIVIQNEVPPISFAYGPNLEKHQNIAAIQWENTITGVEQRFSSFAEFREALHKFSIAHNFRYKYKKSDSHRVSVKCKAVGCPWRIYVSRLPTTHLIRIKKMNPEHTCNEVAAKAGYRATKGWVGKIIKEKLRASANYKPKDIVADIKREYGVQLNYSQALVPLYKNKGDAQCCGNYRGIKLLSHTMKLWERVIETRLRRETQVTENQFGFMPGRSTTEAIHVLRRLMEKYREKKRDLHMVFIDLEKAYDSVPRQVIWGSLEHRGISSKYIELIKDTYGSAKTSVRAPVGDTDFFPVEVGLHQGSALSPFLFAIILDELSKSIQEAIPWCMLFADDIVLVAEKKEELNVRLEEWRAALESKGLRISRSKTEYLCCNFSGANDEEQDQVTIEGQEVPQTTKFKYLGSFVQSDGDIDCDVAHRVQAGWCKWRAATSILCDKKFPETLKGKFYRVAVRPAMLYGTDCWPIKKVQERKMETAEMRMLRWMCGHTRLDRIRNEVFRSRLGVACISSKVREGRLRWFGHVRRRLTTAPVRRVETIVVEGKRSRGRPKLTWDEQIRHDLVDLHLSEDMISDRSSWRRRIMIRDF